MSDAEKLGAAATIWAAVVLLSIAGDCVSSVRVVGRENTGGVEGHARDTAAGKKGTAGGVGHSMACGAEWDGPCEASASKLARAGIKPGPVFSLPTANIFRGGTAAFGLRLSDAEEQSRVATGREAEEHVYHGTNVVTVPAAIPSQELNGGLLEHQESFGGLSGPASAMGVEAGRFARGLDV